MRPSGRRIPTPSVASNPDRANLFPLPDHASDCAKVHIASCWRSAGKTVTSTGKKGEQVTGRLARLTRRAIDRAVVRAKHPEPGPDVIGMANSRHDAKRGAAKCGVHLGDELFESIRLRAEGTREVPIQT